MEMPDGAANRGEERKHMREMRALDDQLAADAERLDAEYGPPCEECGIRVDRAVPSHPGSDEIEYPAGCHAVGCSEAGPGSYHPEDPRAEGAE